MVVRLRDGETGFLEKFARACGASEQDSGRIRATVSDILAQVREKGDRALLELTRKFDRLSLDTASLRFSPERIGKALTATDPGILEALRLARDRIWSHHARQKPNDHIYTDAQGVSLGIRWTPVDAVGLYVPGGLASYPSSVLMNAIPAKVAGVERIAMVVPTPDGQVNEAVLSAASIAGVDEIYRVGGAQAIGALAYGTESIAPVAKIVGPGNAYVAEAKRQVFGQVGIDMIAGPSEVMIIADNSANPAWIAADMLAQLEHGSGARALCLVPDQDLADAVEREVERQLATLPRNDTATRGWQESAAIICVPDLERAVALANIMAPEHLELAVDDPERLLPGVRHAGAIFLGHHTPEAIGDYVGGSNHVLPTSGTARFASGLGTMDFMKRTSLLGCTPDALASLGRPTVTLANAEDLPAHGRSVSIRRNS